MTIDEFAQELNLKRVKIRGHEIHASCPFTERHLSGSDTHPSFSINIDKGVYNCFSCGSKGTLEELVSKVKNISISDALTYLEKIGFSKLDRILNRPKEEERPEIIPEGLLLYYDKVEDEFAELYRGEIDGNECLIYPVRNVDGSLVGGIARSTQGRWHKVLWNMPKKLYFYGENLVEKEQPIVIVEGPGDVISLRKSGIKNVLGLMGVSISDEQIEKLLFLSSEFVVWLDRDKAGSKGLQAIWTKLDNRATVRYVDPFRALSKDEKDPRDVYEKYGPEKIKKVISEAKTFFEHVLEDNRN